MGQKTWGKKWQKNAKTFEKKIFLFMFIHD